LTWIDPFFWLFLKAKFKIAEMGEIMIADIHKHSLDYEIRTAKGIFENFRGYVRVS